MNPKIPVYTINLPQYRIDTEPDHKVIGKIVDNEIKMHFLGQTILVRAVGSQEHPGKTVEELMEIIKATGTDRYDPERPGDRYQNVGNKHIDLFALRRKITPNTVLFWQLSWSYFNFPPDDRAPIRVDILSIYDASKLKNVVHSYEDQPGAKRDGFVFKDPSSKPTALLGIIHIL